MERKYTSLLLVLAFRHVFSNYEMGSSLNVDVKVAYIEYLDIKSAAMAARALIPKAPF